MAREKAGKGVRTIAAARGRLTPADVLAETATGVRAAGPELTFFANAADEDAGRPLSEGALLEANDVTCPEAGAGSYRAVFFAMGATAVEVYDSTSSAGDWTFIVKRRGLWHVASQENAYPRIGFRYGISEAEVFQDDSAFELIDNITALLREKDPDYVKDIDAGA